MPGNETGQPPTSKGLAFSDARRHPFCSANLPHPHAAQHACSVIHLGVNTLFLLDAGLTNTEAFTANAFFTLGMVVFEVPTGVIADTRGRRVSFLLGTITLLASTLIYLLMWQIEAPFWGWALSSVAIGLGFTFFSGAVEAWLVDALATTGFTGDLESVFGRGRAWPASPCSSARCRGLYRPGHKPRSPVHHPQRNSRGHDARCGVCDARPRVHPRRGESAMSEVRAVLRESIDKGWRNPPVRWVMLAAPFTLGVSIYAFYAMQPYLLELYGDDTAYGVAGLAAAILAGAQIAGGLLVPRLRKVFKRRTRTDRRRRPRGGRPRLHRAHQELLGRHRVAGGVGTDLRCCRRCARHTSMG